MGVPRMIPTPPGLCDGCSKHTRKITFTIGRDLVCPDIARADAGLIDGKEPDIGMLCASAWVKIRLYHIQA